MRWQRKAAEAGVRSLSVSDSELKLPMWVALNASKLPADLSHWSVERSVLKNSQSQKQMWTICCSQQHGQNKTKKKNQVTHCVPSGRSENVTGDWLMNPFLQAIISAFRVSAHLNLSGLSVPKSSNSARTPKTPLNGQKTPTSKTPRKTPGNSHTPGDRKTPSGKLHRSMSMDGLTPGRGIDRSVFAVALCLNTLFCTGKQRKQGQVNKKNNFYFFQTPSFEEKS